MGPISVETTIDAPREGVVDVISDLSIRPSYTDHFIHSYRLERIEPRGVGAAARFRTGRRGARTWMDTAIEQIEPPHKISERGTFGHLNRNEAMTVWELEEGPGAVTTVRLTFWTKPANAIERGRELLTLSGPWYRRHWKRALRRLGEVVEGERPATPVKVAGGDRAFTGVP
jgi:uncharacterized protein YndB with AHSA1/START domain